MLEKQKNDYEKKIIQENTLHSKKLEKFENQLKSTSTTKEQEIENLNAKLQENE